MIVQYVYDYAWDCSSEADRWEDYLMCLAEEVMDAFDDWWTSCGSDGADVPYALGLLDTLLRHATDAVDYPAARNAHHEEMHHEEEAFAMERYGAGMDNEDFTL